MDRVWIEYGFMRLQRNCIYPKDVLSAGNAVRLQQVQVSVLLKILQCIADHR